MYDWKSSVTWIKFSEYVNLLREVYPVYGDFLSFFTIRIGDLPSNMSSWLSWVGVLYNDLQDLARNLLDAYIISAFLENNYIPLLYWETSAELGEEFKDDPKEFTKGIVDDLLNLQMIGLSDTHEFVSLESPEECIRVMVLRYSPEFFDDHVCVFAREIDKERDEVIKRLREPVQEYDIKITSYLIVVDPLTYRLSRSFIKELKRKIEEKLGSGTVLSAQELLDYLALNREIFESDWSALRAKAIMKLKEKYKFLALHEEIQRIRNAQKILKEAFSKLAIEDLREADCEEIIRQVGIGVEGLLGVLYHWFKKMKPPEKTFGQMLSELKGDIINEFGKDVYEDLFFIIEKRNLVSHPKQVKLTYEDAVKVSKRAELFQTLLFQKLELSED
jgi:hypothetical protein